MRSGLIIGLALFLAACTATGVRQQDGPSAASADASPKARLTIFRPIQSVQYTGRSASLKLNAESIGGISSGEFRTIEVASGTHALEADMWDAPGRCTLRFTVQVGESAYFEVSPRGANLAAGLPGALLPAQEAGGWLIGGAIMLAGMSAESSGKPCGGAFAIEQVTPEVANRKLGVLRAARQPTR